MIYILSGQDDYSVSQMLEKIKSEIGNRESLEINTTVLDGQKVTLQQLSTACETLPFLTDRRLVIVESLLARFEPKGRNNRQKSSKKGKQDSEHSAFSDCILNMPGSTILVLIEESVKTTNPLYKVLAAKAKVQNFAFLKDAALRGWVAKRVKEEGGDIAPGALNLITRLVGSNLWTMSGEINKLVLYASGKRIEEEDVSTLVGYTQQFTVFNMVDAILEFKAEQAEWLLQQQMQGGAAPVYLITMLARQVRMIVLAKELSGKRVPIAELQSKLGTTSEYVVRKTIEQAGKYSLSRLKEIYHRILETDVSIKTGKLDAELALNILVAELSRLIKTAAAK